MFEFEQLNKLTFFELVADIFTTESQHIETKHFVCRCTHFTAQKQKEIVEAIIAKGFDPRKSKECIRAKQRIIEILIEMNKI